ncbi:MAG: methyl-accepting chemotaxis protein, partial [Planctomycetota bacterium]
MATKTKTNTTAPAQSRSSSTAVFDEIQRLVKATVNGKLDTRGDADKFEGQDKEMIKGINELIDAFVGPINVTAEYVDRISKGDIPEEITDNYNGDFNEIKNNLNQCIGVMKGLVEGAATMAEAAGNGELDTRVDASQFTGSW